MTQRFLLPLTLALTSVLGLGPGASDAHASGYALRTVAPGDTLGAIASRYHITPDALIDANDLDGTLIHPGQVLRIPFVDATGGVAEVAPAPPPGFRRHTLAAGETLSSLSARYNLSIEALVGANPDISSLDRLPAGVELLVPPAEGLVVTLERGDSLTELVAAHGLDPVMVARVNDLRSPLDVKPGMLLFLPGVTPEAAMERLARVREMENRYLWPVHGRITSYFGRRNLGMGTSNFHRGVDVAAPYGTAVTAARSGTVVYAGWSNRGYGNLVQIRHAGNEETWYAHFSEVYVRVGEHVGQGEVIGAIGSTGISTGPHLHFELHQRGRALDPLTELR